MPEDRRLKLHNELEALEACKAYYKPPKNISIEYPCFIYHRIPGEPYHANNHTYHYYRCWEIIFITEDCESTIREDMLNHFPMCRQIRDYTAENLYHHVFNLYY